MIKRALRDKAVPLRRENPKEAEIIRSATNESEEAQETKGFGAGNLENPAKQPDRPSDRGTRTTSSPLSKPNRRNPEPVMPRTSGQNRSSVEPRRTPTDRVIEELRTLDERFGNPRCSSCGSRAHLTVDKQGPVVTCIGGGCKKVERVDVQTLQRLADRLEVTCFRCKGKKLESQSGKFSNYLKCRDDGENNSWQEISKRIGKA
jgi:hypothetical protein